MPSEDILLAACLLRNIGSCARPQDQNANHFVIQSMFVTSHIQVLLEIPLVPHLKSSVLMS